MHVIYVILCRTCFPEYTCNYMILRKRQWLTLGNFLLKAFLDSRSLEGIYCIKIPPPKIHIASQNIQLILCTVLNAYIMFIPISLLVNHYRTRIIPFSISLFSSECIHPYLNENSKRTSSITLLTQAPIFSCWFLL